MDSERTVSTGTQCRSLPAFRLEFFGGDTRSSDVYVAGTRQIAQIRKDIHAIILRTLRFHDDS